jgi:hypothetical protein
MKTKHILSFLFILSMLTACQSATGTPSFTVTTNEEFTLAPGQSAMITDADLTITFHSILGDDRCPSDVECVASGPVTISLSIQQGNDEPAEVTLQTFTDQDGRSPTGQFEGITDRVEASDHLIQIVGVTPYPNDPKVKIESSEYRVALVVSKK